MPNTIEHFIETADDKDVSIVCPACGAPMGVGNQGSYRFMLTERVRGYLDDTIQNLRRFLEGVEATLELRNYAYSYISKSERPYKR